MTLDARPDFDAIPSDFSFELTVPQLAVFASAQLGGPVTLSSRFEVQDEGGDTAVGYYVIPE